MCGRERRSPETMECVVHHAEMCGQDSARLSSFEVLDFGRPSVSSAGRWCLRGWFPRMIVLIKLSRMQIIAHQCEPFFEYRFLRFH